ncbi:hypothetical protein [Paenibacillus chitinolyticus]
MQSQTGYVIKLKGTNGYLDRRVSGVTGDLFSAIKFTVKDDADHFLNASIHAPKDPERFEIVQIERRIFEKEDKHERENISQEVG